VVIVRALVALAMLGASFGVAEAILRERPHRAAIIVALWALLVTAAAGEPSALAVGAGAIGAAVHFTSSAGLARAALLVRPAAPIVIVLVLAATQLPDPPRPRAVLVTASVTRAACGGMVRALARHP
jgi:hypothetical protein